MSCNTDRLSAYLDDELSPGERREVDLHVPACAECREVLTGLALVRDVASRLHDIDRAPDANLWPGVESRLEPGGRSPLAFARRAERTGPRRISLSWMQAVAAGLVLAAI
ncbi:MAG: zf-HC2 domain-containing protein, partial [Acidobacteriota bacterium]|nr:zf-HC2 domain-containing protein [Acidobacteriota bacterium]